MAYTTTIAVQSILVNDYDGETDLNPFIETAAAIVARTITCATAKGITLSSAEKELLERWLAAWAYCMSDKTYTSRSTLSASGSFSGQYGMGLEHNPYGQMALRVDPSGCLNSLDKRRVARGFWLGKRTQDQLTYDERNTV